MNLFTFAAFASAVTGLVAGSKVAEASTLSFFTCTIVGTLTGLLGYGMALLPGFTLIQFPLGRDAATSKSSAMGGMLIFGGAFAAPILAYLVTNVVLGVLVRWYS